MVDNGLQTVVESGAETLMKDCRVQWMIDRILGGCRCRRVMIVKMQEF